MLDILKALPPGQPVAAISLRQPWAGAVVWLGKDVENRDKWPFKYRGPIIIHASAAKAYLEDFDRLREIAKEDDVEPALIAGLDPEAEGFLQGFFEQGCIVGVANLDTVFGPDDDIPEDHPAAGSPWVREDAAYVLYFSSVVLVEPLPWKGAVGLFKVPYEIAEKLEALKLE